MAIPTAAPCLLCGSNDIDPAGWANNKGDFGPQCLSCGTTAESLAIWNNREHLTDLITNAVDDAIRNSTCSSYSEWQTLVHHLLTNQHGD